jgi:hypothetical protein
MEMEMEMARANADVIAPTEPSDLTPGCLPIPSIQ